MSVSNFSGRGLNRDCFRFMQVYTARRLNEGLEMLEDEPAPRRQTVRLRRNRFLEQLPGSEIRRVVMRQRKEKRRHVLMRELKRHDAEYITRRILGAGWRIARLLRERERERERPAPTVVRRAPDVRSATTWSTSTHSPYVFEPGLMSRRCANGHLSYTANEFCPYCGLWATRHP